MRVGSPEVGRALLHPRAETFSPGNTIVYLLIVLEPGIPAGGPGTSAVGLAEVPSPDAIKR